MREFSAYFLERLLDIKLHQFTKRIVHTQENERIRAVEQGVLSGAHWSRDFNERYKDTPLKEAQTEYRTGRGVTMEVVWTYSNKHNVSR